MAPPLHVGVHGGMGQQENPGQTRRRGLEVTVPNGTSRDHTRRDKATAAEQNQQKAKPELQATEFQTAQMECSNNSRSSRGLDQSFA